MAKYLAYAITDCLDSLSYGFNIQANYLPETRNHATETNFGNINIPKVKVNY